VHKPVHQVHKTIIEAIIDLYNNPLQEPDETEQSDRNFLAATSSHLLPA